MKVMRAINRVNALDQMELSQKDMVVDVFAIKDEYQDENLEKHAGDSNLDADLRKVLKKNLKMIKRRPSLYERLCYLLKKADRHQEIQELSIFAVQGMIRRLKIGKKQSKFEWSNLEEESYAARFKKVIKYTNGSFKVINSVIKESQCNFGNRIGLVLNWIFKMDPKSEFIKEFIDKTTQFLIQKYSEQRDLFEIIEGHLKNYLKIRNNSKDNIKIVIKILGKLSNLIKLHNNNIFVYYE